MRTKATLFQEEDTFYDFYSEFFSDEKEEKETASKEEKEPKEEPTIRIEVTLASNIEEGDPEDIALRSYFAHILLINDISNYRVLRASDQFDWTQPFKAREAGKFNAGLNNKTFLDALQYAYSEQGLSCMHYLTDPLRKTKIPFTEDQRKLILLLAELFGRMTEKDFKYFDLYLDKIEEERGGQKEIRIKDLTVANLSEHWFRLHYFVNFKLNALEDHSLLVKYVREESSEGKERLKYLVERLNSLSPELLKQVLAEGAYNHNSLLLANLPFKEEGFDPNELLDFIHLFQEMAIHESFKMLWKNHSIVKEEKRKYGQEKSKEFNQLFRLLSKKYQSLFEDSLDLRVKTALPFLKKVANHENLNRFKNNPGGVKVVGLLRKNTYSSLKEYVSTLSNVEFHTVMNKIYSAVNEGVSNKTMYDELPDLGKANRMDQETYKEMREVDAKQFPILADPTIDFKALSEKNWYDVHTEILALLDEKIENNLDLQNTLRTDVDTVWKLELVVEKVIEDYGIYGAAAKVVHDLQKDNADHAWWMSIGLAVLGIALGIAGFFTGGTTWAGLALLGGSVAVSAVDLYITSEEYQLRDNASNTALDAANELSAQKPDMLALVLSVIGLGIDAGALLKAISVGAKAVKEGLEIGQEAIHLKSIQEAFTAIALADEVKDVEMAAKTLFKALKEAKVPIKLSQTKFIEEIKKFVAESKKLVAHDDELLQLMKGTKFEGAKDILEGPLGLGIKRIYAYNKEAADMLIKNLDKNPKIYTQFCVEASFNKNFAATVSDLKEFVGSSKLFSAKTLDYLGNATGREGLRSLDTTINVLKRAGINGKAELASEIIRNPELRKVVDKMENPTEITRLWDEFKKAKPQSSFYDYLPSKIKRINEGARLLRKGIDQWKQLKNFQAHHIIPKELKKQYGRFLKDIGFNIEDGVQNGMMIPPNRIILDEAISDAAKTDPELAAKIEAEFKESAFHIGSHPKYTKEITTRIDKIKELYIQNGDKTEALEDLLELISDVRKAIKNGNNTSINDIKF